MANCNHFRMLSLPITSPGEAFSSMFYGKACRFVLFVIVAAAAFQGYYSKWHFAESGVAGEDTPAAFEAIVDGTAYRPYVYRRLLPAIANGIAETTPDVVKRWWLDAQGNSDDALLKVLLPSRTAQQPAYAFRYLILYCQTFLWTLASVYAACSLASTLNLRLLPCAMAAITVVLVMPLLETRGGFFYDYPELTLFCLAYVLAHRGHWKWLTVVAAAGTANKESFVLFLLTLLPLSRTRRLLVPALFSSLTVFVGLHVAFRHNPGSVMEFWPREHLRMLLDLPLLTIATEETYGVRLPQASTALPLALLAWTVARAWRGLPRSYRRQAVLAATINLPLYVLCCYPGELRDLSLLFPFLTLCIAWNIQAISSADGDGTREPSPFGVSPLSTHTAILEDR